MVARGVAHLAGSSTRREREVGSRSHSVVVLGSEFNAGNRLTSDGKSGTASRSATKSRSLARPQASPRLRSPNAST
jgi:hypothetical protein